MHFSSNKEKEKWIDDYVDTETTVARKWVEDTETPIKQQQEDMRNPQKVGLTTTKLETTIEEMLSSIGDHLGDLASYDDVEDGEHEDDDKANPELGKQSAHDEPGWVMGTISRAVNHRMERYRQNHMKVNELTRLAWVDAADYFR